MNIGVISDTHDRLETIDRALEFFALQNVELVVHCGDWKSLSTLAYFAKKAHELSLPVRGVLGNNDTDVHGFLNLSAMTPGDFYITEGVLEIALGKGQYLAAYHGHHKPTLQRLYEEEKYTILCLGHTHKPKIDQGEKLVVNPGSTAFSIPRSKEWQPSVAIIDPLQRKARIAFLS